MITAMNTPFRVNVRVTPSMSATDSDTVFVATEVFDDPDLTLARKLDTFLGLTVHEGSHLLYTDFKLLGTIRNRIVGMLQNIFEDERIERRLGEDKPGLANFLKATKYYYFGRYEKKLEKEEKGDPRDRCTELFNAILHLVRYPARLTPESAWDFCDELLKVRDILTPYPDSTQECIRAAEKVYELLKDLMANMSPPPQDGPENPTRDQNSPEGGEQQGASRNSGNSGNSGNAGESDNSGDADETDGSDNNNNNDNKGNNSTQGNNSDNGEDGNQQSSGGKSGEAGQDDASGDQGSEDNASDKDAGSEDGEESGSGNGSGDSGDETGNASAEGGEEDGESDNYGNAGETDGSDNNNNNDNKENNSTQGNNRSNGEDSDNSEDDESGDNGTSSGGDSAGAGPSAERKRNAPLSDSEMNSILEKVRKAFEEISGHDGKPDKPLSPDQVAMGLKKADALLAKECDGLLEIGHTRNTIVLKPSPNRWKYEDSLKRVRKFIPAVSAALRSHGTGYTFNITGTRSGLLDTNRLCEARQGVQNVYMRKGEVKADKLCVALVIDESGSMDGIRERLARDTAVLVNEAVGPLRDVRLHIYGYTDWINNELQNYREGNAPFDKYALGSITSRRGTPTAEAMAEAAWRIRRSSREKVLMFVVSDGYPNGGGGSVRRVTNELQKNGFEIVGISISSELDKAGLEKMYDHYIVMDNLDNLASELGKTVKKVILKASKRRIGA